ncbi:MAG: hypothetical protein JNG85_06100, partial [Spirochaetaceae bacterium]|nr:hypothetical protein [Spirochaetaceae bacterium]
ARRLTERALPFVLGAVLFTSELSRAGSIALLGLCLIVGFLYRREVVGDRWFLLVLSFFALIALKDGVLLALGTGSRLAFMKSSSRIPSLFGAAAMFIAVPKERREVSWLTAVGIVSIGMGTLVILMRKGLLPFTLNPNTFGMLFAWFPLGLGAMLRAKGGRAAWAGRAVLLAGLIILYTEARFLDVQGSRTAALAFALGAFYLAVPDKIRRTTAIVIAAAAILAIIVFSLHYVPALDKALAGRQELWQGYASKGLERPLLGWGFTDGEDNKRLLDSTMRGKAIYGEFAYGGLGPHNGFLAMFFENGLFVFLGYVAIFLTAVWRGRGKAGILPASLMAYVGFMSADAMAPGGITFLGFYLGLCLMAAGAAVDAAGEAATPGRKEATS